MKVQNKTIVVTGGGSGMGRELVLALLLKEVKVVALDINETGLEETAKLAGQKSASLTTHVIDITDKSAVEERAVKLIAENGYIDGLINNAGIIQPFVRVNDLSYDLIDRVMNVNFYGTLYLIKSLLPHLLTRPEAHIINISSMGGFLPVPGQTIYGASKAAVKLLTEGLYAELTGTTVKVSVVFPGGVNTNILSNSGLEMPKPQEGKAKARKILSATEAAQMMIAGIEKDKYRIIVGKDARIMDILYRLNPKSAATMITKQMSKILSH
ncbi:Short-chain dehydrogenase [Mucilaginibacter gossypiicola]|uniref:Short-chain dehydrogenase n=1 Tax=Mucilaginibacter gossypiicola TaxID=551995 RepID=A0A1H8BDU3_9SPHI|nr:SDR family oxidoreductase [Mucilaginibacter gossypiicola]SEM81045.1 Short-chain dehydrogenase [Mucilaginibacter gossypiicola]